MIAVRPDVVYLLWILAVTSLLHLLMIWGEVSLTHPTAHARLAVWEMVRGRYKSDFWIGTVLSMLGGLLPWLAIFGFMIHTSWRGRRAAGFDGNDALRECLRAGRAVSAAGVESRRFLEDQTEEKSSVERERALPQLSFAELCESLVYFAVTFPFR